MNIYRPFLLLFVLILAVLSPLYVYAQDDTASGNSLPAVFELVEPREAATVVGKKPPIRFRFLEIERIQGFVAILDDTGITAVVQQDQYGF